MPLIDELDRAFSQRQFAELVGVGEPAVSDLLRREVLQPGQTGLVWLRAYLDHLRTQATARTVGPLAETRAALDDERRIEVAMRNAERRRQFAPVTVLSQVLSRVGQVAAKHLAPLPGALRATWPAVTADQMQLIEREVARSRALFQSMSLAALEQEPGASGHPEGQ